MSKEAEQHNAIDKLAEVYYDTYCKQILSTPREIKRAFKAGFVSGSQSLPKEEDKWISAEDVRRWFQLLVGKGEDSMFEDVMKTHHNLLFNQ